MYNDHSAEAPQFSERPSPHGGGTNSAGGCAASVRHMPRGDTGGRRVGRLQWAADEHAKSRLPTGVAPEVSLPNGLVETATTGGRLRVGEGVQRRAG